MKANDVSLGTKLIVAGVFIALIGLWITWLALQNPATNYCIFQGFRADSYWQTTCNLDSH
jgi:uncharacterized membrane protein YiaA